MTVSHAVDGAANITRASTLATRRQKRSAKEHARTGSSDWTDEDESPPRRKKSDKPTRSRRRERQARSAAGDRVRTASQSDLGRYFPRLSRILEISDSPGSSRPSTRSAETKRSGAEDDRRRHRRKDESHSVYRRPVGRRTSGVQRRSDSSAFQINPSLLSVLTSLTTTSDRSSGSNSTITQQSYNRRGSESSKTPTGRRRPKPEIKVTAPDASRSRSPNVFDYMVPPHQEHDTQSIMSSSSSPSTSSHYEPSIAGSSEVSDTPSSRSSVPSPTSTRKSSVQELRQKFDPQYASFASGSQSPEPSARLAHRTPSVTDVPDEHEGRAREPSEPSLVDHDSRHRSSSSSPSRSSQRSAAHVRRQEERMRQHMAYANQTQHVHFADPAHGPPRSSSISSPQSTHATPADQAAYAYRMAMQQYQMPCSPAASSSITSMPMNGNVLQPNRPPVPDAPDLSQRTIAGYEMLALELSTAESPVKPVYRKFEYLNHRILLHLQDELSELEEQLRTIDEVIAQLDPDCNEGQRTPTSRRAEAHSHSEIHHRRTALLGRIFLKTEQYNKALAGYASLLRDASPAPEQQIRDYKTWMAKHAPLHEHETRFLDHTSDLILPGRPEVSNLEPTSKHATLAYLPVVLMLPLLLFSIIPSLAGRLAVTVLIAVGAFMVATTTRIRALLEVRDWAVCGAGYVLIMAAVAGMIPQHKV